MPSFLAATFFAEFEAVSLLIKKLVLLLTEPTTLPPLDSITVCNSALFLNFVSFPVITTVKPFKELLLLLL